MKRYRSNVRTRPSWYPSFQRESWGKIIGFGVRSSLTLSLSSLRRAFSMEIPVKFSDRQRQGKSMAEEWHIEEMSPAPLTWQSNVAAVIVEFINGLLLLHFFVWGHRFILKALRFSEGVLCTARDYLYKAEYLVDASLEHDVRRLRCWICHMESLCNN